MQEYLQLYICICQKCKNHNCIKPKKVKLLLTKPEQDMTVRTNDVLGVTDILDGTYRVSFKYCVFLKFCYFSELCKFCCSACL